MNYLMRFLRGGDTETNTTLVISSHVAIHLFQRRQVTKCCVADVCVNEREALHTLL